VHERLKDSHITAVTCVSTIHAPSSARFPLPFVLCVIHRLVAIPTNMPSIRSILLYGLSICSLCRAEVKPEKNNELSLDEVVRWLPEESVKAALRDNLAPKYRDGVFEHGKKAIEAIKNADPRLAAKVVDEALQRELEKPELMKRQNVSTSTTTDESTTHQTKGTTITQTKGTTTTQTKDTTTTKTSKSPNPPPVQSSTGGGGGDTTSVQATTETGVIVSVTLTTTDKSGNTVTKKTSAFETTAETSTVVDVTTTNSAGQTVTTKATVPAAIITTTNAAGKTITTASTLHTVQVVNGGHIKSAYTTTDKFGNTVVLSGTKSGQVITTTDAAGKTVVMTYTPGGGAVSELVQKTITGANGKQSTITSFAVIGGATQGPEHTNGKGPPGLQTNLAAPTGRYLGEMAALLGGAIGMAAML